MGPYFAFCAVVDGIQYKTGLGQNKKESRSNAAKLALDELLQLDETEPRISETSGKYSWLLSSVYKVYHFPESVTWEIYVNEELLGNYKIEVAGFEYFPSVADCWLI